MKRLIRSGAVAALLILIFGILYQYSAWGRLERAASDRLTRESRALDSRIVIAGIDTKTLNRLDRNMLGWKREVYAAAIERMMHDGARAVWLDVLFTGVNDKADNGKLEEVIGRYPNVFVGGEVVQGELAPLDIQVPADQIGHVHFRSEYGKVSQGLLAVHDLQQGWIPSGGLLLANALLPADMQIRRNEAGEWIRGKSPLPAGRDGGLFFAYAQPKSGDYREVSLIDVIDGAFPTGTFKDSVVILGAYSDTMPADAFATSYSGGESYGTMIHANFIQSLLDGGYYRYADKTAGWLWIAAAVLLSSLAFAAVSGRRWAALVLVLCAGGTVAGSVAVYVAAKVVLPLLYPQAAILSAYILRMVQDVIREREERRRVTSLFGRYVSPEVARQLVDSGIRPSLTGTTEDVSVMFVDIRGFTSLCERLEPQQVVAILNRYLELCTNCVYRNGGMIDKFIGDGVMALFGVPAASANHAQQAVESARALLREGEPVLAELESEFGVQLSFGVGIHSGRAVIGNIGSSYRMDYTAIGDTVNTAARLESNARSHQILLSADAAERVRGLAPLADAGRIMLKGKAEPVQVYETSVLPL
ncbi:adenylate/guanylate cyclase domain-containing protein [Paenibacillus sp. HN-1]|uniref:adenylate/guanylate cyclase domain-containing protein n=1 Tax=Paenibacillus TaxID=44249 RepID=UPI001CA9E807|nr:MULTISPECIES: adenylate/guanylate cyclase domain-containing protein [Paenibacillus]MBY9079094.1 adenylate/guanylate cyclase domain-containing protein [Paenibacillus sp. CGMCC 1.18879]MBY9086872.1 adenylate/guanylate cyclase domain-containing protein [Paenibacillus sinensis]